MYATAAVLFCFLTLSSAETDEFIKNMKAYSEQFKSFESVVKITGVIEPLFKNRDEAIAYEKNNIQSIVKSSNRKITFEQLKDRLEKNVNYYVSPQKLGPTIYTCKCLDINTYLLTIFSTQENACMQIKYAEEGLVADYELAPSKTEVSSLTFRQNRNETRYHGIEQFYYEMIYGMDLSNVKLNTNNEGMKILQINLGKNTNIELLFDKEHPCFPTRISHNSPSSRTVYENKQFYQIEDTLFIPKICALTNYKSQPVKGEWEKEGNHQFELTSFHFIGELKKNDLNYDVPISTKVHSELNNTSFLVTAEKFGNSPKFQDILNFVKKDEKK
ncbi:MAG: hypothetical protein AB1656_05655 [Candidatus Omnitrophota bacterium]